MLTKFLTLLLAGAGLAAAQGGASTAEPPERSAEKTEAKATKDGWRQRIDVGFRVRGVTSDFFYSNKTLETTTTKPAASNSYTTTTDTKHVGLGATLDYRVNPHLILSVDLLHSTVNYTQTLTSTRTSDSAITTVTESTRASYWDIPIQGRLFDVFPHQPRRMFVSGGGVLRATRHIRTSTTYEYPDDTTDYNENQAKPERRLLPGAVIGAGFRFVDDYRIKVVPEIRYTHWFGSTFKALSTQSRPGELEILIGFSF